MNSISHESRSGSWPESSPGLRTLVVPRMAARGMALTEIAAITHVPLALVELIAGQPTARPHSPAAFRAHPVEATALEPVHRPRRSYQRKLLIRLATAVFLAAATLTSVMLHAPLLPIAVMVAGGWLGRANTYRSALTSGHWRAKRMMRQDVGRRSAFRS